MIKGFWKKLKNKKRPILALAPMADVTDAAFRRIIAKYGKPDVMFRNLCLATVCVRQGGKTCFIFLNTRKKKGR